MKTQANGNIPNFFKCSLQEARRWILDIILTADFCTLNNRLASVDPSQQTIP